MDKRVDTREIIITVFSAAFKIVLLVIAAMLIYKYALIGYDYGYRIFGEEPMTTGEGRKVSVTVGSDMGVKDIGQVLENKGLIRDAKLFVIQERLSEYHGTIEPGIYELSTAMTAEQMIAVMSSKKDEASEETEEPVSETGSGLESEEYFADDDLGAEGTEEVIEGAGEVAQ